MPSLLYNEDGSPHTHIYVRRDKKTYKCLHPSCTHWMWKKDLQGKRSICSVCMAAPILLDPKNLKLARPRCVDCSETKESKALRETREKLQELGLYTMDLTVFRSECSFCKMIFWTDREVMT